MDKTYSWSGMEMEAPFESRLSVLVEHCREVLAEAWALKDGKV